MSDKKKKLKKPVKPAAATEESTTLLHSAEDYPGLPLWPATLIVARDADNARKSMDPEELEDLEKNIESEGLLEPIGLRILSSKTDPLSADDRELLGLDEDDEEPEQYAVATYGFRRFAAICNIIHRCPEKFADGIPYIPVRGNRKDSLFSNLNENIARSSLTPGELADRLHGLRYDEGLSTADIVARVPFTKQYVQMLIRIKHEASEDLWNAFYEGKVSYDTARQILGVTAPEGGDVEALQAKALNAALKKFEAKSEAGKQSTSGTAAAVAEASGGIAKPKGKEIVEKIHSLTSDEESDYEKGARCALEWALGKRSRIPLKPTSKDVGPVLPPKKKKGEKKPKKSKDAEPTGDEDTPVVKAKKGPPKKGAAPATAGGSKKKGRVPPPPTTSSKKKRPS